MVLARDAHCLAEALRSTPLRGRVRRVGCLLRRPCLDLGFRGGKACHAPAPGPMLLLPGTIPPSLLVDMKHGQATRLVMRCDVQMIRLFPHPQSLISCPASGSLWLLEDIDNVIAAHERDGRVRETNSIVYHLTYMVTLATVLLVSPRLDLPYPRRSSPISSFTASQAPCRLASSHAVRPPSLADATSVPLNIRRGMSYCCRAGRARCLTSWAPDRATCFVGLCSYLRL